ncbi:MAG: type I-E CRISPR-associated protein Cse2/CasB [Bifidobacteriaceae bacterium]|jgi:CRISPR system Cascade subunit CasB|nr:type I-E CRISPR-associated protein Cse2/CasB [Bifidobacteriaceae bacterium]MCI1979630.1 type I-E CRISPR-associated protein Cse2/CasB [Bifidobacteriaceae bacterium]
MEQSDQATEYKPHLNELGQWIASKVRQLSTGWRDSSGIFHRGYINDDSYSTAVIAKLNHAAGHEVGDDPDIFAWTFEGMPENLQRNNSEEVTSTEVAAHVAVTLFAVHQHSVHEASMTTDSNVSLGYAAGKLAVGNPNEAGIRRDFDKLQTASSWRELVLHARRLVRKLKREKIAINYGLFAQDILSLRSGREAANQVRRRWGMDYLRGHRFTKPEEKQQ